MNRREPEHTTSLTIKTTDLKKGLQEKSEVKATAENKTVTHH